MNNMTLRDIDWQLLSEKVAKIEVVYQGKCADYDTICPFSKENDEFCEHFCSKECDSVYLTVLQDSNFMQIISLDAKCERFENNHLVIDASEIDKEFSGNVVITLFENNVLYPQLSSAGLAKKIIYETHQDGNE